MGDQAEDGPDDRGDVIFETSKFTFKLGDQSASLSLKRAIAYVGHNFPKDLQGLFLWPAAEAMAEFSLENANLFAGKKVIEIGAGTGMLGLAIASIRPPPEKVVLTDGCKEAIGLLEANIKAASTHLPSASTNQIKSITLESGQLVWGQPLSRHEWKRSFHVVVGADLVYDQECDVHGLLQTAEELLMPQGKLIIGMVNRSGQVEGWFEEQLNMNGCDWNRTNFAPEKWTDSKIIIYTLIINAASEICRTCQSG